MERSKNNKLVGLVLMSSAFIVLFVAYSVKFPEGSPVPLILFAVAAADALIGVIFFFRGVQAASEESDPLVVRQDLRAQLEALSLSAGPLREKFRSPQKFSHVAELILRKQKIEAIKLTREDTGLGLKEAKELVEQIEKAARRGERAGV